MFIYKMAFVAGLILLALLWRVNYVGPEEISAMNDNYEGLGNIY